MALPVQELSLLGLLARIHEVERIKEIKHPTSEELEILESEQAAKKAVAELLENVGEGFTLAERKNSREFLETQIKAVVPGTKAADARRLKLTQLLDGVNSASSKEEPAHVRRAKDTLKRAEADYEDIRKAYEKWERGKQMLDVDALKTLKRSYADAQSRVQAARKHLEATQELRTPSSAAALAPAPAPPRPKVTSSSPSYSRGGGPAFRVAAAAPPPAPLAPPVHAPKTVWAVPEAEVSIPISRPRPQKRAESPPPILSYACTAKAVAEQLSIEEDRARELSENAVGFEKYFDAETWKSVQQRSVKIEKEKAERQRDAEKRKSEAARQHMERDLQERDAVRMGMVVQTSPQRPPPSKAAPKPKAPVSKAKPKPAFKAAVKTSNRFAGFVDSDGDDDVPAGFTTVKGRRR